MATFVQLSTASGSATLVGSTQSPSTTVTNGNLLVCMGGGASTTIAITSVTDTLGGLTWSQCTGAYNSSSGGANDFIDIWWAVCTSSTTGTVTTHYSSNVAFDTLQLVEYSLAGATATFEVAALATSAFTTSTTSAPFSPSTATNLAVAFASNPGGGITAYTADASYTIRDATNGVEDRVATPSGSQTASFSWTGNNWGKMSVAAFKLATASASTNHFLSSCGAGS